MADQPGTGSEADKLANAKEGGRSGSAPADGPRLSPEATPLGRVGTFVPDRGVQEIGGAPPENRGSKEKLQEDLEESSSADWGE